jgi:hypothetical protein
MNIEHEGKTYEVLTLDRISEITHARLAGGKVVDVEECPVRGELCCLFIKGIWFRDWNDLGIQPLRLVPKEPVTWVCEFGNSGDGFWFPIYCLDDALAYQHKEKKRFRCVEIVEEESILKAKGVE